MSVIPQTPRASGGLSPPRASTRALLCYSDSRNLWTVMRAGGLAPSNLIQPTISLEMPVPSQGHYVFTVFRLLTDFVCLYNYEFWLSLCKIVRSSVILLLPLFDPLGTLSGPHTPRLLTPPLTTNPGSAPDFVCLFAHYVYMSGCYL
jgi:hypothetical protein